jgi:hypothetical protein
MRVQEFQNRYAHKKYLNRQRILLGYWLVASLILLILAFLFFQTPLRALIVRRATLLAVLDRAGGEYLAPVTFGIIGVLLLMTAVGFILWGLTTLGIRIPSKSTSSKDQGKSQLKISAPEKPVHKEARLPYIYQSSYGVPVNDSYGYVDASSIGARMIESITKVRRRRTDNKQAPTSMMSPTASSYGGMFPSSSQHPIDISEYQASPLKDAVSDDDQSVWGHFQMPGVPEAWIEIVKTEVLKYISEKISHLDRWVANAYPNQNDLMRLLSLDDYDSSDADQAGSIQKLRMENKVYSEEVDLFCRCGSSSMLQAPEDYLKRRYLEMVRTRTIRSAQNRRGYHVMSDPEVFLNAFLHQCSGLLNGTKRYQDSFYAADVDAILPSNRGSGKLLCATCVMQWFNL